MRRRKSFHFLVLGVHLGVRGRGGERGDREGGNKEKNEDEREEDEVSKDGEDHMGERIKVKDRKYNNNC